MPPSYLALPPKDCATLLPRAYSWLPATASLESLVIDPLVSDVILLLAFSSPCVATNACAVSLQFKESLFASVISLLISSLIFVIELFTFEKEVPTPANAVATSWYSLSSVLPSSFTLLTVNVGALQVPFSYLAPPPKDFATLLPRAWSWLPATASVEVPLMSPFLRDVILLFSLLSPCVAINAPLAFSHNNASAWAVLISLVISLCKSVKEVPTPADAEATSV